MANIKSAKKRVLIAEKANLENTAKKARIKTTVKKYNAAVEAGDYAVASELLKECVSLINKAKSDGIYHQNTASRKIAALTKALQPLKDKAAAEAAKATEEKKPAKKVAKKAEATDEAAAPAKKTTKKAAAPKE